MSNIGPAELLCRATSRLATQTHSVQATYGGRIRSAVAGARAAARNLPESEIYAARPTPLSSPDDTVWLPGRLVPSKAEREAMAERGEKLPRVWFRSDAVDYDILVDAEGKPSGLSFTSQGPDLARRAAWSRAADRRGDREYEKVRADAIRGRVGYQWQDRTHAEVVPAPWYYPDEEDAKMFSVSPHGSAHDYWLNVKSGHDASGEPRFETVRTGGWSFGNYLATNPDFWRIAEQRGGDMVVTGCDIGNAAGRATARTVYENGFDRPIHGANGGVFMQANNPDGTLQAREVPGRFDPEWDQNPTRSTLAVTDGEFITVRRSDFPRLND